MQHDYDEYYDTKVSRPYGRSKAGCCLGLILSVLGLIMIAITITDMFISHMTQDKQQTDIKLVYTWDENPFWPSYGKGFWVGLIIFATGLLGCVSSCEHTLSSIYAFTAFAVAGMVLSFYLMITALIPIAIYTNIGSPGDISRLGLGYYNSLALNAVLVALGGFGTMMCLFAVLSACCLVGCCKEKRGRGADFLEKFYDQPYGGGMAQQSMGQQRQY